MHHAAGVGLLMIGGLMLIDRLTQRQYPIFMKGVGATWIGLGIFLFIRSDPEAWPMGPPGFWESFSIPTTSEWVQHKLLSMIPMFMGVYTMKGGGLPSQNLVIPWHYVAAALAGLGGLGLLIHQHLDHPEGMDIVNIQHRFFALTAMFIAASLILDVKEHVRWRSKPYFLPIGLLVLGLQLFIYVE
jgi:putative copper resistance protein D